MKNKFQTLILSLTLIFSGLAVLIVLLYGRPAEQPEEPEPPQETAAARPSTEPRRPKPEVDESKEMDKILQPRETPLADGTAVSLLRVEEIETIQIYSRSGEQTEALTEEETEELTPLLSKIELFGEGDEAYWEWDGGIYPMFRFVLADGETFDFAPCSPFCILEVRGYRCVYQPSETIGQLYWEWEYAHFPPPPIVR